MFDRLFYSVSKYNSSCYSLIMLYIMLLILESKNWSIFFLLLRGETSFIYLSDVFLMIRILLRAFGGKTTEAVFYSSCQVYLWSPWLITTDVDWWRYPLHVLNSLRTEYLYELPRILQQGRFSSSPLFSNLSNHVFIISMDSWVFILYTECR